MFLKITRSNNYQYVQLIRSYRENGVVKHEVVLNLGRLDTIENNPSFQRLALRLQELSRANPKQIPDLNKASEAEILNWGYIAYQKLWKEFSLHEFLPSLTASTKVQFSLADACFLMTIQHLLSPMSKLGTFKHQQRYVNMPEVSLNHLYRSLDILCDHKERLEQMIFHKNRTIFNMQVDVIFYDVTTFSFESVKADTLRDFGFSKNGKFNEVQVVMGLLLDCEGRPIGYELFPGNTFDSSTLEAALEKLKERFGIRRVIIVADRGINSKINLKRIADQGYSYIFASRLKSMKRSVQEEVFSDGYQEIALPGMDSEEKILYKVIDYVNRVKDEEGKIYELKENLVITYSPRRARKDRADRERLIEKAKSLLENKSRIKASNKRGGKKYLKEAEPGCVDWVLDEERIRKDERFDGYYGIQTNEKNMSAKGVLAAYHDLWKIEESFRIMKSTLEVQPVFHWTERRIKGHFVVCFLAFLLARTLEFKLRKAEVEASADAIREAMNSMNFAKVEIDERDYLIKTRGTDLSNKILRLLRIKPPPNVLPADEFQDLEL
ncbi:MAG: IS1634 family transposase [Syntrophothermus sp.]|uniref:IS1634 family transposase n=1 Tax=Syntrophothermus sp. TaxID=2736299 RepID=UPI00257D9D12|nr:IS1634 family transposase [Syntrophothermus sp.]NSW83133.1 IS1634 family transposase [Syntrophothermus sp.]